MNMTSTRFVFTARCTLVQSAVLGLHVVRLSVRPSVTLVDQDHIGWKSWKLIVRAISSTVKKHRQPHCSDCTLANFNDLIYVTTITSEL